MTEQYDVTSDPAEVEKVQQLMSDMDIAMVTTTDSHGEGTGGAGTPGPAAAIGAASGRRLVSRPLSTQVAEDNGDALFLVRRSSHVAEDVMADPQVNVAYSSKKAWLSLSGTAEIVEDRALVEKLWSKSAGMFMDGGPENPDNVILRVHGETAVYWGGESMIGTIVQTAKSVVGRAGDEPTTVVDLP